MAQAHKSKALKPTVGGSFSLPEAYEIQREIIELLNSTCVGYKAALSSALAQAAFEVTEPLLGALLEDTSVQSGFDLSAMLLPMIEVEMGYELGVDVTSPVSVESFDKVFSQMYIAIDIPEVGYASKPSAVDLVSGNSAAGRFIRGPAISTPDSNDVQVKLSKDGALINEATSGSIGDQRALAVWLVNKALSLGYPVTKGMFLMSGALGKILPADAGQYSARYESEGQLLAELSIELIKS